MKSGISKMEDEGGNEKRSPSSSGKIDCKSKRAVNLIVDHVLNSTGNVVNESISEENEKDLLKQRINQIYTCALNANILIDGQPVNNNEEADTTSEFEAFDLEKERYLQHELMNCLHTQLAATTQLRKTGPHQLRSRLKKNIRPELKYLALATVEVGETSLGPGEDVIASTMPHVEERLQGTTDSLATLNQESEELLVKSKDFIKTMSVWNRPEPTELQEAMFETPPNTPATCDTATSRLQNNNTQISKKLLL